MGLKLPLHLTQRLSRSLWPGLRPNAVSTSGSCVYLVPCFTKYACCDTWAVMKNLQHAGLESDYVDEAGAVRCAASLVAAIGWTNMERGLGSVRACSLPCSPVLSEDDPLLLDGRGNEPPAQQSAIRPG